MNILNPNQKNHRGRKSRAPKSAGFYADTKMVFLIEQRDLDALERIGEFLGNDNRSALIRLAIKQYIGRIKVPTDDDDSEQQRTTRASAALQSSASPPDDDNIPPWERDRKIFPWEMGGDDENR